MHYLSIFHDCWRSKWYRAALITAGVFAVLFLLSQAAFVFTPGGEGAGADLQASYLPAAERFLQRQPLYMPVDLDYIAAHYLYAPAFAILFIPFTLIPIQASLLIQSGLHLLAYCLVIFLWARIFHEFHLEKASRVFVWMLPVWLVYSPFWDDLNLLNIYTIMALVGTLFIEAMLNEKVVLSSLWLTLILVTKPQFAVLMAVPLLLGRYRFFLKLAVGAIAGYFLVGLLTALASSPGYSLAQYGEQFQFLVRLSRDYPWRGPENGFLGYNHSIKQIVLFLGGVNPGMIRLADILKGVLLLPLGIVMIKQVLHPARIPGNQAPRLALELTFLLYLGAFIWLDLVWDLFLAIAIVIYLLGEESGKAVRAVVLVFFMAYALLDILRVILLVIGSPMLYGTYFLWDYSAYIPVIMLVVIVLYWICLKRLWRIRIEPGDAVKTTG